MYVVVMLVLIGFSSFLVRRFSFYKNLIAKEDRGRFEMLDGLRGFLAINVFFQHAVTTYFYFQKGVWEIVPIPFYRHLGGQAVILFFMITSFLYWSKAIAQKGEVDAGGLYRSRFLRLAPMYLFTGLIILFSVCIQTGFDIDLKQSAKDILSWLSLGLITTTSIGGVSILPINAGVHWTLAFEWGFYLLMPMLAISLKSKKTFVMGLPLAFFALSSPYRGYWAIFFFGMAAAHIYKQYPNVSFFRRSWSSVVPLAGMCLIYLMSYKPYSFTQYFVALAVFLSFVYGADMFGVLRTQVAKFLGTISYSLYLLHSIILFAVMNTIDYYTPITDISPALFWSLITVAGLLTILVSAFTYYYIEYPFIQRIKMRKTDSVKTTMVDQVM